jgi:SNF2 family DNA or RNA helicase
VNHEIVLTTYATLVADFKRRKVLHSLEWFRVILDEAHWIRNPSSKQFKAISALVTERRWCVSGTPIQNCLNDLVSLLRFLKFEPFCDLAVFQKYILEPLGKGNLTEPVTTLQHLLQSLCLRREGQCLNLPSARYSTVGLSLHPDEQKLYDDVFKRYRRELDEVVSSGAKAKKTRSTLRFSMISALRRLCNHGTLLEPPATLTELDVDTSCDYCSDTDKENMAKINGDSTCPECHRLLSASTRSSSKSYSQSPQPSVPGYRGSSLDAADTYTATLDRRPLEMHSGLSTKLQAVANNICSQSKRYCYFYLCYSSICIADSISLVFSYWTTTLDLLQMLLEQRQIAIRRIDGRLRNEHRLRVLEEFNTNPDISVLLLTMQTGAVG